MYTGWEQDYAGRYSTMIIIILFLLLWLQVTAWHHRGKFHRWQMWIPVVFLPITCIAGLMVVVYPVAWTGWMYSIALILGIIAGGYGSLLHLLAIGKRTGGMNYENIQSGLPFALPAAVAMLSLLGFLIIWM
ncbi:hypothetical protein ACFFGV_07225 [Pontibacillus salicampi]|uniref:Uncharacterized protein n=1 Tax=Pontibacillus salicampi TaxID=1449801 RepID=A0ABV6LLV2_9BACI